VELVRNDCSVDWLAAARSKDQIPPVPYRTAESSLTLLAIVVFPQVADCNSWQGKDPAASLGLRFNQLKLAIDPLQLLGNS